MHFKLEENKEKILDENFTFEQKGENFTAKLEIFDTNAGKMFEVFDKLQAIQNQRASDVKGSITEDILSFINEVLEVKNKDDEIIEIQSFETAYLLLINITKEFLPKISEKNKLLKTTGNKKRVL